MSAGLVLFLSAVVIVTIVAAGAIVIYLQKNFPSEKFDERQKISRGNAYCFSHWMGMLYYFALLVYFVFHTGKQEWVLEPFLLLAIGILIQLQSFHIYCLMTHSALPLGEKPMPAIIGNFTLGGLYFAQYYLQYIPENVVGFSGADSYNLFRLLIALDFVFLAVLHLIAYIRDRKE